MKEDDDPRDLYRRVTAIAVALKDHGSKDVDDTWIKRKFLKAIMPFNKAMSSVIRQRPDFHSLSSSEVLDEFIAMSIMNETADNALARVRSKTASPNLALKAKAASEEEEEDEEEESCPEDTKYAYHEHMALASRQFWGNKRNSRPNFTKNNSSGFKPKQRVRTCYNCGNVSHFVAECPYEKREDNGGKLIRKDKTKSFPNKNNFVKKPHPKGMVALEEYPSDDDDDDDMVATATVAIATPSPKNVSLFNAPNDNHIAKCLMAKGIDQVTPSIKTNITTAPSLLNCVDDSDVVELNEHDLDKFLCTIKGETKRHFVALLEQLGEANDLIESHEETISELQGHSRDYADEIAELSIALEKERTLRLALEESYNDDCAKMQKKLDHDTVLTRMLKSEKYALGVGHDRLKVEFDTLDKAHKVLKGVHFSLKESHDQLQAKLTKEISTCPPFVLIDNACATNPCCEHVHLVEENAKLKEKLEKGLVACIQGEKSLNDLLSTQKGVVGKEGLGLTSKSKGKRRNRNKRSPTLMDIFVKEGEGTQKVNRNKVDYGNLKKGKTIPTNTVDKLNSSYVLCRASDGHVYARFVGSYDEYIEWAIWVPKTLVSNMKGPIKKWVPKTKP